MTIRPEFEQVFNAVADEVEARSWRPLRVWHLLRKAGHLPESYEEALLISRYVGHRDGWAWHLFQQSVGLEERTPALWGEDDRPREKTTFRTHAQARHRSRAPSIPPEAELLGLTAWPCPVDELKRAYRRAARRTHPDAGGTAEQFRRVSDAFEVLKRRL